MMLATVGDLVEDLIVSSAEPLLGTERDSGHIFLRAGADTDCVIERRRGGSAANVAAVAASLGVASRFIGQVGDDDLGDRLVASLAACGVETVVSRAGRTGSVLVLCHDAERSMLTDRGSSVELAEPSSSWLDGVGLLHVPLYSMATDPLAETIGTLAGWAHERGIPISVDLSATSLLHDLGPRRLAEHLDRLAASYTFANDAEMSMAVDMLGVGVEARVGSRRAGCLASLAAVEKRGSRPARLALPAGRIVDVEAEVLDQVADTTGAGDAFAAGFLAATLRGLDPLSAVSAAHAAAADHLRAINDRAAG